MNEQTPQIEVQVTSQEGEALYVTAAFYRDLLEVVEPLKLDTMRQELIDLLERFQHRFPQEQEQKQEKCLF